MSKLPDTQWDELCDLLQAIAALAQALTVDPSIEIDRTALALLIKREVEQAIRIARSVN